MLVLTQHIVTQHQISAAKDHRGCNPHTGGERSNAHYLRAYRTQEGVRKCREEYAVRRLNHVQADQTFRMQSTLTYPFGMIPFFLVQYQSNLV